MRYARFIPVVLVLLLGCKSGTTTEQVDPAAVKKEVAAHIDKIYDALHAKDMKAFGSWYTDDCLFCGTAPKEFWTKDEAVKLFTQMANDPSLNLAFTIDRRDVRVGADGTWALVQEQYMAGWISTHIPVRAVTHLVKTDAGWKIDYSSVSMIPKNADLARIEKSFQ